MDKSNPLNWGAVSQYRSEIMGFATLWVLFHHNFIHWASWATPLRIFATYGNCGVDIFLFLSGISLTYSLKKNSSLPQFYVKRFLRLIIPYLMFATPYWIWYEINVQANSFWQNFLFVTFPLRHVITFWYIPTMACCYLLFPFIYGFAKKAEERHDPTTVACWSVTVIFLLNLLLKKVSPQLFNNIEIGTIHLGVFTLGCVLSPYVHNRKAFSESAISCCAVTIVAMVALRLTDHLSNFWIRISYLFIALSLCILLCTIFQNFRLPKIKTTLRFLGARSLEIYLIQIPLRNIYLTRPFVKFDDANIVINCFILALTLFLATVTHPISAKIYNALTRKI